MNEAFATLFSNAGPVGCIIIGCFALTAVGCFAVYKFINSQRKESRQEIDSKYNSLETRYAVLQERVKNCESDLKDGTLRFGSFDESLKNMQTEMGKMSSEVKSLTEKFDLFLQMQGYTK